LVIAGNHKPGLRNVDEAMRRRLKLIPFAVKIPKNERDLDLAAKLKAEWPGILQWMIDGCLAWQADGLSPPAVVTQATDNYLEAEDAMGLWLSECCDLGPYRTAGSTALFKSWKQWAEAAGEWTGSQKWFSQLLEARGFGPKRIPGSGKAGFEGIALQIPPPWTEPEPQRL
jgi:putative DNA primase/helicase